MLPQKNRCLKRFAIIGLLMAPIFVNAQTWQRVLPAYVNDTLLAGAYSGGVNYSRPYWVDIDGDNDKDLFIGGDHGGLHFYRNVGSISSPSWQFVTEYYKGIDVENRASQAFVDIDGDNDYDLFIGEQDGNINFYRNVGSAVNDTFVLVTSNYESIDIGSLSAPFFCDIDNDNDFDMFIGCAGATIYYYRNDGSSTAPLWTYVTNAWFGIDVNNRSIPWFADIDADNDYDFFSGDANGFTWFYRNDGTASSPNMVFVTSNYIWDIGNTSAPSFFDYNNDGDLDMFIGEFIGNLNWWKNIGTPQSPSWDNVRKNYLTIDVNSSSTPVFVDIDNDGDYDLFSGEWVGIIDFYENTGTATAHRWTVISENYGSIDVGDNSAPTFVDIDNDNDYDLFIGNLLGNIYYYRNDGSAGAPNFTFVTGAYNGIDAGDRVAPVFIDIDNDNDYDMFIGNDIGTIWHYRNDGSASSPTWTYVSNNYAGIDVGERSVPVFADIDYDNDYDLFIGEYTGTIYYYRNDGSASSPSWTFMTSAFQDINVEENTAPTFVDINNDGDLDLFIGERWGGLNYYEQITGDVIPPQAPYIYARRSGNNVILTWNRILTDTLGNAENMHHYVVYRSASPSFIPGASDSINGVLHPETTYTDIGVINSSSSYYYLVKAVDVATNRSKKSNMGYKFNKSLNENPGVTSDRNWTSIPWHSNYTTVSDLTADLSPSGDPLITITNLRYDQAYESWLYDELFGWYGADFFITSGRSYEAVTIADTLVRLVGSNNPNGLVVLNENSGAVSDRNWVSIPYNAIYSYVSNITNEYSPAGNPLSVLTNMRDDQAYESWLYDDLFGWYGADFQIERGRGYEFVSIVDTTWNPIEYSNVFDDQMLASLRKERRDIVIRLGKNLETDRSPVWEADIVLLDPGASVTDYHDASGYQPVGCETESVQPRIAGIPHIICGYIDMSRYQGVFFTAYRYVGTNDVITQDLVGSGLARKGDLGIIWFNVGNFKQPWENGEVVSLIVEAVSDGRTYFGHVDIMLDRGVDIQPLGDIKLTAIPKPVPSADGQYQVWTAPAVDGVIGYSLFANGERINDAIIGETQFKTRQEVDLRPVLLGGFETVYSSNEISTLTEHSMLPVVFAFSVYPNPIRSQSTINYALPVASQVSLKVYDISGRLVRTLVAGNKTAGYYTIDWKADNDQGCKVPAGIYFMKFNAADYCIVQKLIYLR